MGTEEYREKVGDLARSKKMKVQKFLEEAVAHYGNQNTVGTPTVLEDINRPLKRDIVPGHGRGNDTWHILLDFVRNSDYRTAIEENLTSFANGIWAELAFSQLARKVQSSERGNNQVSGGDSDDSVARIEDARRKATQAKSVAERALIIAADLQRISRDNPGSAGRNKPSAARPRKKTGGGSGD